MNEKDYPILWAGDVEGRGYFRVRKLEPDHGFCEQYKGTMGDPKADAIPENWTSEVSNGVCAEVWMTAFFYLQRFRIRIAGGF